MPRDRVELIARESAKALASPELKRIVEDNGLFVVGSTPDELTAYVKKDYEFQGRLMDELEVHTAPGQGTRITARKWVP